MAKNYWMVVQTTEDFEISRQMGFTLHGLRFSQRRRAQRMEPQDSLLYYVSGLRRWSAIATVTSTYFEDRTPVWTTNGGGQEYPYRVKLEPALVLDEKDYIDALQLAPRLEYLKRWAPERWPEAFVDTLHLLPQRDFRLIEDEMKRVHPKWRNRRRGRRQPQGGGRGRRRDFHVAGDGPTLMYEPPPAAASDTPSVQQAPDPVEDAGPPPGGLEERPGAPEDAPTAEHETRPDEDANAPVAEHESPPDEDGDGPAAGHKPRPDEDASAPVAEHQPSLDTDGDVPIAEQASPPNTDGDGEIAERDTRPDTVADDGPVAEPDSDSTGESDNPAPGYKPRVNTSDDGDIAE